MPYGHHLSYLWLLVGILLASEYHKGAILLISPSFGSWFEGLLTFFPCLPLKAGFSWPRSGSFLRRLRGRDITEHSTVGLPAPLRESGVRSTLEPGVEKSC